MNICLSFSFLACLWSQRRRDFLQSGSDSVMECPAPIAPFLTLIKLPCSLLPSKQPSCYLWLGYLSVLLLFWVFSLALGWNCIDAVKSLNWGRSACLLLPQGQRHPEEQLMVDARIFQSHCGCAGGFNPPRRRCASQWSLLFRLSPEWMHTGSLWAPPRPICHHGHIKHWFYFPRSEMMKSISNRASYICSYLFIQIPWHLLNISHCIYFKD